MSCWQAGLDFENPDVPSTLQVVVSVSNTVLTTSVVVTVTVVDVDEVTLCAPPSSAWVINENQAGMSMVGTLTCVDPDASSVLVYDVVSTPAGRVGVHSTRSTCHNRPEHISVLVVCV